MNMIEAFQELSQKAGSDCWAHRLENPNRWFRVFGDGIKIFALHHMDGLVREFMLADILAEDWEIEEASEIMKSYEHN